MGEISYAEASVPVGAFFIVLGAGLLLMHGFVGVFTSWLWAVLVAGLWLTAGSLFLFPDVRLYQYDQSPLEKLLIESEEV